MKTQCIRWCTSIALLLGLMPVFAFAQETVCATGLNRVEYVLW